jgi:hypothetical protein
MFTSARRRDACATNDEFAKMGCTVEVNFSLEETTETLATLIFTILTFDF